LAKSGTRQTTEETASALKLKLAANAVQSVLRLEWKSRLDCRDLLQSRNQLHADGWANVEEPSGTGDTLEKDIPAVEAAVVSTASGLFVAGSGWNGTAESGARWLNFRAKSVYSDWTRAGAPWE